MAVQTITRNIQVRVCDECQLEQEHLDRCGVCRKDKCHAHMAYSVEISRYADSARGAGRGRHICQKCATRYRTGTIRQLLDLMLSQ